jgi:hypothetical protein
MKLGIFWINDDGTIFVTHKVAFDTASRGDSYRVDDLILWIICIRYLKALKNSRHKLRL